MLKGRLKLRIAKQIFSYFQANTNFIPKKKKKTNTTLTQLQLKNMRLQTPPYNLFKEEHHLNFFSLKIRPVIGHKE